MNRHPPFGNQVRDSAMHLPKYELYIDQVKLGYNLLSVSNLHIALKAQFVTDYVYHEFLSFQLSNYSEHCAEITISVTMINATSVTHKSTAGPNHTCVLLIGNSDNQVVFKARVR